MVLKLVDNKEYSEKLLAIAQSVQSGDINNRESYAAKTYFKGLFTVFRRSNTEDWRNLALNYGYSILRGLFSQGVKQQRLYSRIWGSS